MSEERRPPVTLHYEIELPMPIDQLVNLCRSIEQVARQGFGEHVSEFRIRGIEGGLLLECDVDPVAFEQVHAP